LILPRLCHLQHEELCHRQFLFLRHWLLGVWPEWQEREKNGKQKRVSAEKLKPLNIWRARQDSNL
jgi:hypothetical protein